MSIQVHVVMNWDLTEANRIVWVGNGRRSRMKKGISIFLFVCVAFSLTFTPAFAQSNSESVLIHPLLYQNGSTITVTSDQEIILGIGWAACTPGLVRAFLGAVRLEWTLNGQRVVPRVQIPQYWGKISELNPPPSINCMVGRGTVWGTSWRYSLGTLPRGKTRSIFTNGWRIPSLTAAILMATAGSIYSRGRLRIGP
jgi:hypothetical protein